MPSPRINIPYLQKKHSAIVCRSEQRKQPKIEKIAEPDDTEEIETDNLMNIITHIKHVTDRRNHFTMTKSNDKIENLLFMSTGSPVIIIQSDTEIMKNSENSPIS